MADTEVAGHEEAASRNRAGRTELFLASDPDPTAPVVVFHHIRKTAGSSFRRLLEGQLHSTEKLEAWAPYDQGHPPLADLHRWNERLWGALTQPGRDRVICIASHCANYVVPLIDRPTMTISMVRDPVDRVLSRYYFSNRIRGAQAVKREADLTGSATLESIFGDHADGDPGASDEHRGFSQFFNGQARSLLDPVCDTGALRFTDGPPADAELWIDRLDAAIDSYDWIGVQDRFEEFAKAVVDELGGELRRVPKAKVNVERPREAPDPETADLIRRFNWLDDELCRRCADRLETRLKRASDDVPSEQAQSSASS